MVQGNLAPIFFSGGSISDCVLCVYGGNSVDCMTLRGKRIIMVGALVWKTAGPQLLNSTKLVNSPFANFGNCEFQFNFSTFQENCLIVN